MAKFTLATDRPPSCIITLLITPTVIHHNVNTRYIRECSSRQSAHTSWNDSVQINFTCTMPKYALRYFDGRARGEITRLLLVSQGKDFDDKRYSQETWPAEKAKTPFGQLPVLTIDGKDFTESVAIERYLAREFGMYGSTNLEGFEIDQVIGICLDLFEQFVKGFFEKDETKKKEMEQKLKDETVPRYIGNIEKLVSKKGKGYCVGKKLSLGDLAIFNIVDPRIDDACLSKYPHVKAIVDNVKCNDKIKAYLAKRKETPF